MQMGFSSTVNVFGLHLSCTAYLSETYILNSGYVSLSWSQSTLGIQSYFFSTLSRMVFCTLPLGVSRIPKLDLLVYRECVVSLSSFQMSVWHQNSSCSIVRVANFLFSRALFTGNLYPLKGHSFPTCFLIRSHSLCTGPVLYCSS